MSDLWFSAVERYPDHVEAEYGLPRPTNGEVVFGEGADRGLLARGYCLEGVAEVGALAEFDLDEDEGVALKDDKVEFAVAGTVVALDKGVAAVSEVFEGEVFAPAAGGALLQGPTPA